MEGNRALYRGENEMEIIAIFQRKNRNLTEKFTCYKTSTGTNKMRKSNALYTKRQRFIAETQRDTQIHRETRRERHRDTHRITRTDTHRETHPHTDMHTKRHIQGAGSKVYHSFCYTHESYQITNLNKLTNIN